MKDVRMPPSRHRASTARPQARVEPAGEAPRLRMPPRRTILAALPLAVGALHLRSRTAAAGDGSAAGSGNAAPSDGGSSDPAWSQRAALAWQALLEQFSPGDGSGLLREKAPTAGDGPAHSTEWPYSQAHVAALDLTGTPGGQQYRDALARMRAGQDAYWAQTSTTGLAGFASAPLADGGGTLYYDDNAWVGLLDVQRFAMTGDQDSLREARKISDLIAAAWSEDPDEAAAGGIPWTQDPDNTDRNTVTNMPSAELDVRLYQFTEEERYLDRALQCYQWTNQHLQRPDGLYSDHLDRSGTVDETVWSYNQGVPVGVNVRLAQVTGQPRYLREAQRIAEASYGHFVDGGRLDDHPPFFNAIWFKNLLLLESETGEHRYRDAMAAYAERMWSTRRVAATGLFSFGEDGRTELHQQAAMVQVFAVLAWNPADHHLLY